MGEENQLPLIVSRLKTEYLGLLEDFHCGYPNIEIFLKEKAFDYQRSGKGVTYLVLNEQEDEILAYYTLASAALLSYENQDIKDIKNINDLKIEEISAIEIKMFAVKITHQDYAYDPETNTGRKLRSTQLRENEKLFSNLLLGKIIGDIYTLSLEQLGIEVITLHSVPEATDFYGREYFEKAEEYLSIQDEYIEGCTHMYMNLYD